MWYLIKDTLAWCNWAKGWLTNFRKSIIAVHRTVHPAAKSFDLALGGEKNLFMHTSGKFSTRALGTASPTRGTGHTHLISRFLFFHLSSGFFARRCNHLCLPLSIHHLPIADVIRAAPFWSSLCAIYHSRSRRSRRPEERRLETQKAAVFSLDFLLHIAK